MVLSCIKIYVWIIFIDLERKVIVYGLDKVNEILEFLFDEFFILIVFVDWFFIVLDIGMCGIMWFCLLCFFILYRVY